MLRTPIEFLETVPLPALLLGFVCLLWGGHWLVDGSVVLARRLGLSPLLIGLTIVAFGTSAPELAFNIIAAVDGKTDLSFGNVVGSNIANIALVLGLAAVVSPLVVNRRVVRRELPVLLFVSVALVVAGLYVTSGASPGGEAVAAFTRLDGTLMMVGFLVFTLLMVRMSRKDRAEARRTQEDAGLDEGADAPLVRAIIFFVLGLGLLLVGGKMAEIGAIGVARWLGWSDVVIGLTVVAFATSLPEVVTTLIAARKGQADLAVGNIVGSNLFNILLVLGATSSITPVAVPLGGHMDLAIMLGLTVFLLGLLVVDGKRTVHRVAGVFLLVIYVGYVVFTVLR